jgi:hypothetical protein
MGVIRKIAWLGANIGNIIIGLIVLLLLFGLITGLGADLISQKVPIAYTDVMCTIPLFMPSASDQFVAQCNGVCKTNGAWFSLGWTCDQGIISCRCTPPGPCVAYGGKTSGKVCSGNGPDATKKYVAECISGKWVAVQTCLSPSDCVNGACISNSTREGTRVIPPTPCAAYEGMTSGKVCSGNHSDAVKKYVAECIDSEWVAVQVCTNATACVNGACV